MALTTIIRHERDVNVNPPPAAHQTVCPLTDPMSWSAYGKELFWGVLKVVFKKYSTRWTETLVFFSEASESSHKKGKKRAAGLMLSHSGTSPADEADLAPVPLSLYGFQTGRHCSPVTDSSLVFDTPVANLFTRALIVPCPSQMLWPHYHRYWHFECVSTGVKYFPHREACFPPLSIYY